MVNITPKVYSLRKAVAMAVLKASRQETIDAVLNKQVPKGDVYEFSRAAGLLAIKKTSDVIPDCHPLPIEFSSIHHRIEGLNIIATVEVHTVYKTGVEVEAMHGASIAALTMYDMLKPIDHALEIVQVRLLSKQGGKTDYSGPPLDSIRVAVIVCSDQVAAGKQEDRTGISVIRKLHGWQLNPDVYQIIPDDMELIRARASQLSEEGYQLLLFAGGTGLSPRDLTPEAIAPLIDREIPGIMEAARQYGQQRTPYAMLSRGVAGFIKKTLVLTLPGSVKGAEESLDAVFPYLLHVFKVAEGMRHNGEQETA
jgi:molybdenum cofactor biosynthesis protein MoaC